MRTLTIYSLKFSKYHIAVLVIDVMLPMTFLALNLCYNWTFVPSSNSLSSYHPPAPTNF